MSDKNEKSVALLAGHPLSTWSALIAGAIAIYSSHVETKDLRVFSERVATHTDQIGGGHYEAIIDLRKKVDYIFGKVIEHDARLKGVAVLPPGPPSNTPIEKHWTVQFIEGNCEACPECCTGDAGVHEEADSEESNADGPPEKKEVDATKPVEQKKVPFEVYDDMKIKWKPLNRKKMDVESPKD